LATTSWRRRLSIGSSTSRTGAMLFFQLMTRRYEHASTVLTSNKGFEDDRALPE
jgi:hypothetical protein